MEGPKCLLAYMLRRFAADYFHMFQLRKCVSAAEFSLAVGLEGSQTWTKPHSDQEGRSYGGVHSGDSQLTLIGFIIK